MIPSHDLRAGSGCGQSRPCRTATVDELRAHEVDQVSRPSQGRHCCQEEVREEVIEIASWNVNSIRARAEHVKAWLEANHPDVLLLQELKGTAFPSAWFKEQGYDSVSVTQKTYNGVAILSRRPIEIVSTTLFGDEADSHARFLEVMIENIRIVNIYLPNGNPVGTAKFDYKLSWMDRLKRQMKLWLNSDVPTVIGGDFNVIPEDIDCHKPASWIHDALFQPEPRARYRAMLDLGYIDAFRSLHPGVGGQFTFWDYFRQAFEHNRGIRIDHFLLTPSLVKRLQSCEIDKGPRTLAKPSDHTPIVLQLK
jgi:exodeoxyribonuclease III